MEAFEAWCKEAVADVVRPAFVIATGDLTDAMKSGTFNVNPLQQYKEEWESYRQALHNAGV